MHYLFLNGGPRKGNTWKLAELVKAQITQNNPSAECRELHLAELHLPFCAGCSNCFRRGQVFCPHRDCDGSNHHRDRLGRTV